MILKLFKGYIYMQTREEEWIAESARILYKIMNFHVLVRGIGFISTCLHIWKIPAASKAGTRLQTRDLLAAINVITALQVARMMHVYFAAQKFSKILLQEMLYLTELLTWVMNLGKSPWYIWRYAFQSFAWLLKIFNKNTQYLKQRRYNKRLCSTIVCCWKRLQLWKLFSLKTAMLKGRFRIINKRCECKLENAK